MTPLHRNQYYELFWRALTKRNPEVFLKRGESWIIVSTWSSNKPTEIEAQFAVVNSERLSNLPRKFNTNSNDTKRTGAHSRLPEIGKRMTRESELIADINNRHSSLAWKVHFQFYITPAFLLWKGIETMTLSTSRAYIECYFDHKSSLEEMWKWCRQCSRRRLYLTDPYLTTFTSELGQPDALTRRWLPRPMFRHVKSPDAATIFRSLAESSCGMTTKRQTS